MYHVDGRSSMRGGGRYEPGDEMLGGFTSSDGTIEFFTRVNAILEPHFTVLDFGAGRGSWYFTEYGYKHRLHTIKGKVANFICADIDEAVLTNPTSDRNIVMLGDRVPLEDHSVDVIVSDFVLEHIRDVRGFEQEISRLLKPGGYFCARTPHALHYVSLCARLIRNARHVSVLRVIQPMRDAADVFPTAYRLNTLHKIHAVFRDWSDYSYLHSSEPRYFFGSRRIYRLFVILHAVLPKAFTGNVFVFLRKGLLPA
jgi:SAM-dependent methyltransferase